MDSTKATATSAISQATIYVTQEAYDTAMKIKDLDYFDRAKLCDEFPGFENHPGYHLKNANKLKIAVLPIDASVAAFLPTISLPTNLRGCIFEQAANLPDDYAEVVSYWSGPTVNTNTSGAVYFQNQQNEYMVNLGSDPVRAPVVMDRLLSEGQVVEVTGIAAIVKGLTPEDFIEVRFPVDPSMLGNDVEGFQSVRKYGACCVAWEQVYLKVADILASPDHDRIYIDLLCNELIDYGYWY
jgi:hypothetical protein